MFHQSILFGLLAVFSQMLNVYSVKRYSVDKLAANIMPKPDFKADFQVEAFDYSRKNIYISTNARLRDIVGSAFISELKSPQTSLNLGSGYSTFYAEFGGNLKYELNGTHNTNGTMADGTQFSAQGRFNVSQEFNITFDASVVMSTTSFGKLVAEVVSKGYSTKWRRNPHTYSVYLENITYNDKLKQHIEYIDGAFYEFVHELNILMHSELESYVYNTWTTRIVDTFEKVNLIQNTTTYITSAAHSLSIGVVSKLANFSLVFGLAILCEHLLVL